MVCVKGEYWRPANTPEERRQRLAAVSRAVVAQCGGTCPYFVDGDLNLEYNADQCLKEKESGVDVQLPLADEPETRLHDDLLGHIGSGILERPERFKR